MINYILSISDNGKGISPGKRIQMMRERVEEYEQTDATTAW